MTHSQPRVTTTLTQTEPLRQYRIAELALRRRNLIYLFPGESSLETVHTFLYDMALAGYRVDDDQIDLLFTADSRSLGVVVDRARAITGAHSADLPTLNPDFRNTVPGLPETELYRRALLHYLYRNFGVQWLPPRPPEGVLNQAPLVGRTLRPARVAHNGDIADIAAHLVMSSQPFSETDAADVVAVGPFVDKPSDVPVRENLALLAARRIGGHDWAPFLKSPTDVLRVASELSGGDRSLGRNTRFKLRRADRRYIVAALQHVLEREWEQSLIDVTRHEERWKRLLHTLHPQEYPWADRVGALREMVHGPGVDTGLSREAAVEQAVGEGDVDKLIAVLRENPGDFARRLHAVTRQLPQHRDAIIRAFREVAPDVAPRVLVQMWNFFYSRPVEELPFRVVLPKRNGSTAKVIVNSLSADVDYRPIIEAIEHGLAGRLAGRRFRIESDLPDAARRLTIPLGVRSASSGTRTVGRGSMLPIGYGRHVRFFLHWRNVDNRATDLDLTALYLSADGEKKNRIAYTRLRDDDISSFHSGDITTAPNGAAEYVQFDIDAALRAGYRYVVLLCFSYSLTRFKDIPEAQIGVMAGADLTTGADFEASEVVVRIDLTTDSYQATPAVIDLQTRQLLWVDWSAQVSERAPVNIETNLSSAQLLLDNIRGSASMNVDTYLRLTGAEIVEDTATGQNAGATPVEVLDPFHTETLLRLLS